MLKRHFLLGSLLALSTSLALTETAVAADHAAASKGKVLIVVASPAQNAMGWPVGFWASELTHPYDELTHAGYTVEIASPKGGEVSVDAYSDPRHESGYSAHDFVSLGFLTSPKTSLLLKDTKSLEAVNDKDYAAIIVAGGQAPMFTFRSDEKLQTLIRAFYDTGRPTAALCHGVSALVDVKTAKGDYLVKGKKVTGFSLAEDEFADKAVGVKLFTWNVEPALKERGAKYVQAGMWADFAVADKNLITGQQQNSGRSVARLVMQQLAKK